MRVLELAPGLWRWTGLHPDWTPDDEWDEEVGCVYFEAPGAVVLIDPLVPPEDESAFFAALDRDVERAARPVVVLLTVPWHARSSERFVARYDATAGPAPEGVRAVEVAGAGGEPETLYWLEGPRALVAGDVLLGGPLRVCPDAWLPEELRGEPVRAGLRPLLELPVEFVLTSHGEPVLEDGRAALARALA